MMPKWVVKTFVYLMIASLLVSTVLFGIQMFL